MTVASTAHTSISPKPSHQIAQRPPNDGDQRPLPRTMAISDRSFFLQQNYDIRMKIIRPNDRH